MITDLKVGDWVVDDMAEWCKITRIQLFDDRSMPYEDKVWGYWGNWEDDRVADSELFTNRMNIVSKCRTKKQAMKYSEFVYSLIEEDEL